jgi:selT/selW/selH-like putative selenoprotein
MDRLSIIYCGTCNYRPIAASLSRAIESETGLKPALIHSRESGAFEIALNDELIFSKNVSGRFPDFAEIVETVREKTENNDPGDEKLRSSDKAGSGSKVIK